MTTITVNGKSYDRVEDMPPEVRQAYELAMGQLADKNQSGTPDVPESGLLGGKITPNVRVRVSTHRKISYKGQVYQSVDEMPAEARQAFKQTIGTLDAELNAAPGEVAGAERGAMITPTPPIVPAIPSDPNDTQGQRVRRTAITLIALLVAAVLLAVLVLNVWLPRLAR